jgi:hypothetical protein
MNTVKNLNYSIQEFVLRPENSQLRPATGSYSTPFRGQLFGCDMAEDVEEKLAERNVSVLFLGSNPNCPGSLDNMTNQSTGEGDWQRFQIQPKSGYFGERVTDQFGTARAWDPLHNPSTMGSGQRSSWTFYADAIRTGVGSLDDVAMANVFSWGSGELDHMLKHLRAYDPGLLGRVISFANKQLTTMLNCLRPQLVLCPLSISNHHELRNLLLSRDQVKDSRNVSPSVLASAFTMKLATTTINDREQRILFIKHPSALRWNRKADRPFIAEAMSSAICSALVDGRMSS